MEETDVHKLFKEVLHLTEPWYIESISLNTKVAVIEVSISYSSGSLFACPECEKSCKIHDSVEKRIRHLDLFEYKSYLLVKVPRTKCITHGVKTFSNLPFGRSGSHFSFFLNKD